MTVLTLPPPEVESDSEEWFRLLCEVSFDAVMVHRHGRVLALNDRCAGMFGFEIADCIGRSILEFTAPECRELVAKHVREARLESFEAVALRANGERIPVEVRGATGKTSGVRVTTIHDISDRKVAERELRAIDNARAQLIATEYRYRELVESTHDLLCEHDLDGKIVSVNPAAARALGIPRDELLTMSIRDLLSPEGKAGFEHYLATITRNGAAEGLMALQSRSGQQRTWHYRNALRRGEGDRPVVRGLAHDVTDREEALHALRSSERHFRSIIENCLDVISIIDQDGLITYHSPSAERLLGYSPEELDQRRSMDFVHPEDRERAAAYFQKHIESPGLVGNIDLRMRHRDGSWRWLSIESRTVQSNGRVSIITNGRDVTDRRLLEDQLQQANRLTSLGQLTATVAHEFNNVLMSMQPFADLLQRPNVSPESVAKGASHIASSIARGKRVAQDMLRFARPAVPSIAPVDLRAWWERLVPELQAPTGNLIEFTWSFEPSLHIRGDAAQLSQVFANLINNARDAMPCGGTLRVVAERARPGETRSFGSVPHCQNFAHIRVEDSGHGMPEHVHRHAFDPLFTTKKNGGTGLGLAVAHQVVTRHGGLIFVESEVDRGTTFHLFLPLTVETHEPETQTNAERAIRARKILIVEDEPSIAEGTAMSLRDRGLIVVTVDRGRKAEPAARVLRPDVALIDVRLPDIDGVEVGRQLRALDADMKIVFASGHADEALVRASCAGAMFLQKPFEIPAFIDAIAALEEGSTW
ncbi:MAG: hypothetical protein DMF56_17535 [Acidobacteria bacterium]|nr:MAG: hypothetical protein DMF56_17535 [Acidobacteriota bacterium]